MRRVCKVNSNRLRVVRTDRFVQTLHLDVSGLMLGAQYENEKSLGKGALTFKTMVGRGMTLDFLKECSKKLMENTPSVQGHART